MPMSERYQTKMAVAGAKANDMGMMLDQASYAAKQNFVGENGRTDRELMADPLARMKFARELIQASELTGAYSENPLSLYAPGSDVPDEDYNEILRNRLRSVRKFGIKLLSNDSMTGAQIGIELDNAKAEANQAVYQERLQDVQQDWQDNPDQVRTELGFSDSTDGEALRYMPAEQWLGVLTGQLKPGEIESRVQRTFEERRGSVDLEALDSRIAEMENP